MKRFVEFLAEDEPHVSEFAHPTHPSHDLWKHGVPALRNNTSKKIYVGKRGDAHWEMYDDVHHTVPKGQSPRDHWESGFYHTKNKTFHSRGVETHGMDSTDLMTRMQRDRYFERRDG